MTLPEKLKDHGLDLPEPSTPGGSYVSVNVRASVAYVAIQFPIYNEKYLYTGRLGEALSTDDGYKAARLCALNILAQVHHKIGFAAIEGLNHMDIYFQAAPDWDDSPRVANGVSDLMTRILEQQGTHSRALFGVEHLPRNFSVGITSSFTLK